MTCTMLNLLGPPLVVSSDELVKMMDKKLSLATSKLELSKGAHVSNHPTIPPSHPLPRGGSAIMGGGWTQVLSGGAREATAPPGPLSQQGFIPPTFPQVPLIALLKTSQKRPQVFPH